MKKIPQLLWSLIAVIIIAATIWIYGYYTKVAVVTPPVVNQANIHDGSFVISGQKFTLVGGVSEVTIGTSSVTKTTTRYFGNDLKHDFNNDGLDDLAFLITQDTGGSGLFYYEVVLLNTTNGSIGSEALYVGDRIAPQSTNLENGNVIVVNFADRKPGEAFSVKPSVGKSLRLLFDAQTMRLGEVVTNFEGEADPSRMTLKMKPWTWISTKYNNDTTVQPRMPGKFSVTFKDDKKFTVTTDCNSVGGTYLAESSKLIFGNMFSTMMYCANSQEAEFSKMLESVQSFMFTSKGELVLNMKLDTGTILFK